MKRGVPGSRTRRTGQVYGRTAAGGHNLRLVLLEPEIGQNAGTIGRLCVGTDTTLHLVHPLGFDTGEAAVRRAGLDYWPRLRVHEHASLAAFAEAHPEALVNGWFTSGLPAHTRPYTTAPFRPGDWLWFGRESSGLPAELLAQHAPRVLTIPLCGPVRGLNVAQAAAIVLYGALMRVRPDLFAAPPAP